MTESILGIWNPTKNTLKSFEVMHDVLAKDDVLLELGICTLHNEFIQYRYSFNMQRLLSDWQMLPPSDLSIACFRPISIFSSDSSGVIPVHSIGHIAVTCLGVIDNLSEVQEKLISYGYQLDTKNVAETLCYLFHNYLEFRYLSPVEACQAMLKRLKGHFALMALVRKGKWLMVGSRDYPLAIGKNNQTVYFSTDTETLAQFSPSKFLVPKKTKPSIFCATSFQRDVLLPSSAHRLS
jgi:glutamine phosphoribosylpyrophosphate amidotransferase